MSDSVSETLLPTPPVLATSCGIYFAYFLEVLAGRLWTACASSTATRYAVTRSCSLIAEPTRLRYPRFQSESRDVKRPVYAVQAPDQVVCETGLIFSFGRALAIPDAPSTMQAT